MEKKERDYRHNGELGKGMVTRTGIITVRVMDIMLEKINVGGLTVSDVMEIAFEEYNEPIKYGTAIKILNSIKAGLKKSPSIAVKEMEVRKGKTRVWLFCMNTKK